MSEDAKSEEFEPNIVAFLCNWCSYAGADLAGTSRMHYLPNIKIIRVMCSGRVNPLFLVNALQQGADGVLISGCHPGDCHYLEGNYFARRRFMLMRKLLEHVGVDPGRVNMSWVSASELSLIHISEPTRLGMISYAVFCLKKKKKQKKNKKKKNK